MKKFGEFVVTTFVAGLLLIVPIFLAVLLPLKAMQSVVAFVKPFAMLLPEWIPAENRLPTQADGAARSELERAAP